MSADPNGVRLTARESRIVRGALVAVGVTDLKGTLLKMGEEEPLTDTEVSRLALKLRMWCEGEMKR